MAVLSFQDFAKAVTDFVGDNTSDEAMTFLSDSLDTIQDMQKRNGEDVEALKRQLDETEKKWRQRYMSRFHSGIIGSPEAEQANPPSDAESIGFESLFTTKKG